VMGLERLAPQFRHASSVRHAWPQYTTT
jgi:hypothetical protein